MCVRRLVLLAILLTGCTTGSPQAAAPPQPTGTQSTSTPASSLSCRLPVDSPTQAGEAPGGWIAFPQGTFERDPASLAIRVQDHLPSWDRALNRWLPVERRFVAPDGLSYVINGHGDGFYLVDALSGSRRQVSGDGPDVAPGSWTVAAYDGVNLYLWSAGIATAPGLWIVNVADKSVRRIGGDYYWDTVGSGIAWTIDPKVPTDLLRLDIATGSITRSTVTSSRQARVIGTQGTRAVVFVDETGSRQLLIADATSVSVFPIPDNRFVWEVFADRRGLWVPLPKAVLADRVFAGELALIGASGKFEVVASVDVFAVAGGCL